MRTARCLLAAPALLCSLATPSLAWSQSACRTGEWSTPRMVWRAFDDSASMHPNDLAADSTQLVIASEPASPDDAQRLAVTPLAIRFDLLAGGSSVFHRPSRRMSYSGLRVLLDARGVAHLFWSEQGGVTVDDTTGGHRATQIWTSQLTEDSLTPATLIYASREVRWDDSESFRGLGVDRAGRIHLVVPVSQNVSDRPLVHLVRVGDRWTVSRPDLGRRFLPTDVALVISRTSLHVVFTSPDPDVKSFSAGAVFHVRQSLNDTQWSPVTQVRGVESMPARKPRIDITPAAELRVFWLEQTDPEDLFTSRVVGAAASSDGGTSFVRRESFTSSYVIRSPLHVRTDACGVSYLQLLAGAPGDQDTHHVLEWREAGWVERPVVRHDFEYLGRTRFSLGSPNLLTRVWSSGLYGPGLPTVLMWFASHQRLAVPDR